MRSTPMDEAADWLRLMLTDGVGSQTARRLLAAFGPPAEVLAQPRAALAAVAGRAVADALARPPDGFDDALRRLQAWLAAGPHRLITLGDAAYPVPLLQTADPPVWLHVVGEVDPADVLARSALAVVGSRHPTAQGLLNARAFARDLAAAGWVVVSGLADGIDGAAHEGALQAQGCTVAVLGTGADQVFPRHHTALAGRIVSQGGLLISEYPLGAPPLAGHFPRRNRIISGLSRGVLVVEATPGSGSLITARQALEQGREVFALPGSIHSPQSRGCHALIREGARLVESIDDITQELGAASAVASSADSGCAASGLADPLADAPAPDDPLLAALGLEPMSLDELLARTGWPIERLQARLFELELAGDLVRLPGARLQRLVRA